MGNNEKITIETKLEQIPLLVKDGAIIPMISSIDNTTIEVRYYGTKENTYLLYNDDGVSYNYEKGEYTLTELKVEKKKSGKLVGSSNPLNNNKFNYGTITWSWMTKR
jgi:alpha-D-xyloside xylohydrolase